MNATVKTICQHQSVRNFKDMALSQEQMDALDNCIVQTSSTCFLQFVTTIKIRDKAKLAQLATLSGNQGHIAKCDTFYMFCLDLTKFMHLKAIEAPFGFKFLFAGINDCSLACQNVLTAAESMGLGGVVIGGYKSSIAKVSELLKLPQGVVPLLGLCIGVVDENYLEEQKPRLPKSWLIMEEEFKDPFNQQELEQYDAKMKAYYSSRKYNQRQETWTEASVPMIKYLIEAQDLIDYLKSQGFNL